MTLNGYSHRNGDLSSSQPRRRRSSSSPYKVDDHHYEVATQQLIRSNSKNLSSTHTTTSDSSLPTTRQESSSSSTSTALSDTTTSSSAPFTLSSIIKALMSAAPNDHGGIVVDDFMFFPSRPLVLLDQPILTKTVSVSDYDTSLQPPSPFRHPERYYTNHHIQRGEHWLRLLNPRSLSSRFSPDLYNKLIVTQSPYIHLIEKDTNRTFPTHPLFKLNKTKKMLTNILSAYSIYDFECGYSQGMAFIVGFLLLHLYVEEDVFWCTVCIMYSQRTCLRCMYAGEDCAGLVSSMAVLHDVMRDPAFPRLNMVAKHMALQSIDVTVFATQWFVCVYAYRFNEDFSRAVWDRYLARGLPVLIEVAVGILEFCADTIVSLPMDALIPHITTLYNVPVSVLNRADSVQLPQNALNALEKCKLTLKKIKSLKVY